MGKRNKALCVVAHPDDETIWMGGKILKEKDWDWTILSLCRKNDKDRAPKFRKVCKYYGARGIISDLDDERLKPLSTRWVKRKILDALPRKSFDFVFTHGENGEYGHLRHKEIHKAVKSMVEGDDLSCEQLYFFSYVPGVERAPHDTMLRIPVANEKSDLVFDVGFWKLMKKRKIVTDIYGFKKGIFETLSCGRKEAFVLG